MATPLEFLRQARFAIEQIWQRLASHSPSPEIATSVEELKALLSSEQFIDSWSEIERKTSAIAAAYKQVYLELFDRRRNAYLKAIDEIKLRPEWEPLRPVVKEESDELPGNNSKPRTPRSRSWPTRCWRLCSRGLGQTKIERTSAAGKRSERQV